VSLPMRRTVLNAVSSSHISISGAAACPTSTPCNTFDYDSGYGFTSRTSTTSPSTTQAPTPMTRRATSATPSTPTT
jgi:hypothetical protein